MALLRDAFRIIGMVVGIVGAIIAFIIVAINFTVKAFAVGIGTGHTPTGIAMAILALIGALLALPFPRVSSALMLIAGIVLVLIAGWLGVIPLVVLAIAALLVFLDRNKRAAARA